MDSRGQGALEYLLLIGGAVAVAAIVIVLLMSFSGRTEAVTNQKMEEAIHKLIHGA